MRLIVLATVTMAAVSGGGPQSAQVTPTPAASAQAVLTAKDGIAMPAVIYQEHPKYTPEAMRAGIQGFVALEFVVEIDGSVGDVRVVTSLDQTTGLDAQAVSALKKWRFRPATKDGVPVRARTNAILSFSITGAGPPLAVPVGFDAGPQSTAKTWTREVVDVNNVTISFAYPGDYTRREPASAAIGAANPTSLNSIIVSRPNPLPADIPFPLPVSELVRFSQTMARQFAPSDKGLAVVATGQVSLGATNWLWLEVTGGAGIPGLSAASLDLADGMHVWIFNTSVRSQLVNVMCFAPTLKNETADDRSRRFSEAKTDCSEVLKRISLTPK